MQRRRRSFALAGDPAIGSPPGPKRPILSMEKRSGSAPVWESAGHPIGSLVVARCSGTARAAIAAPWSRPQHVRLDEAGLAILLQSEDAGFLNQGRDHRRRKSASSRERDAASAHRCREPAAPSHRRSQLQLGTVLRRRESHGTHRMTLACYGLKGTSHRPGVTRVGRGRPTVHPNHRVQGDGSVGDRLIPPSRFVLRLCPGARSHLRSGPTRHVTCGPCRYP
jgi:hypothetical protein